MDYVEIKDVVRRVEIPDKTFHVDTDGGVVYVQIRYEEEDVGSGVPAMQHGRKWRISKHATESEIVQTCLAAALASAEHQVREHFTYTPEGSTEPKAIFGPHFNVLALHSICGMQGAHEHRGEIVA